MTGLRSLRGVLIVLVWLCARPVSAQPTMLSVYDFIRDWQISKRFTLAVAQAMPAASYDFKATPEEMTFSEQMMHLTSSLFVMFIHVAHHRAQCEVYLRLNGITPPIYTF